MTDAVKMAIERLNKWLEFAGDKPGQYVGTTSVANDDIRTVLAALEQAGEPAAVKECLTTEQARIGKEFDAGEVEPFAYMLRDSDGKVFWDEDMCIWTHREDAEESAEDRGMTMFGVYDGPVASQSRGQAFDGDLPLKFDPRDAKRWWEGNMKESKFVSARLAGDGYVKFHWRDVDESGDYSVPWTRIALWLAALSEAREAGDSLSAEDRV